MTKTEIDKIISAVRNDIKRGSEGLIFDPEPHKYYFNGVEMQSVSAVCELFTPEFDQIGNATRVAKKRGVPVEVILEEWSQISKNACDVGTDAHAYGEYLFHRFINDYEGIDKDVRAVKEAIDNKTFTWGPLEHAVSDVWKWLANNESRGTKLYPVAAENQIVNPKLRYAGTFDLLFLAVRPDDTYGLVIFDYKTNVNLFNIFKSANGDIERMKYPFNNIYNCNIAHYMCQLNLYQLGLERVCSVPVWHRILFWVNPEGVNLIDLNDASVYNAYQGTKWPRLVSAVEEVGKLKKFFGFRKQDSFGMVSLPHVAPKIKKALEARIKTFGKL